MVAMPSLIKVCRRFISSNTDWVCMSFARCLGSLPSPTMNANRNRFVPDPGS
jgi:hypothetical protein